ncbi:MAG: hypothetical protein DCC75_02500 [Proteobacteria bacterium]|nr:MAG: hypothetical protein DCC75_02500 [Pseudomonadota bacterium]
MSQAVKTKKIFDGRYEILSIVGRGARSVVYHARHVSTPSSEVALKVLLDEKEKRSAGERLRKEALAMVSSRHKYVVRLDDFHSVGSLCYLSMEFAPESDLRRYKEKCGGKLKPGQVERYLSQAAEALAFVHKAGIIHRDVKPDNMLVMSDKEIRLADFGLAVLPGEKPSREDLQSGVGTMLYLAPEVLEGRSFDQRADIYALGVTFYEMLAGFNPFEKAPLAQQIEVRKDESLVALRNVDPNIPPFLDAVIMQAISFDPDKRFTSAKDLVQALLVNKSTMSTKGADGSAQSEQKKAASPDPMPAAAPPKQRERQDTVIAPPFKPPVQKKAPEPQRSEPTDAATPAAATPGSKSDHEPAPSSVQPPQPAPKKMEADETVQLDPAKSKAVEESPMPFANIKDGGSTASALIMQNSGFKRIVVAAVALAVLYVVVPAIWSGISSIGALIFGSSSRDPELTLGSQLPSPIPEFTASDISFPRLTSGLYSGVITGLKPGQDVPLAIVSFDDSAQLVIMLGLEGWNSVITKLGKKESAPEQIEPIRVASGGTILEMAGKNIDGEIFGYYRNVIDGSQGEFRLHPVQKASAQSKNDGGSE